MKTATAKDVHQECAIQSSALIHEAKKIISQQTNNSLIDKIKSMGFVNSSSIKDKKEKIEAANIAIRYSLLYPQNNFLTELVIEKICKKYGLLFAESSAFIGEIPVKNQMEMASFKLADEDMNVFVIDRAEFQKNVGKIRAINRSLKKANFWRGCSLVLLRERLKSRYIKIMPKRDANLLSCNDISIRKYLKPEFKIISTPDNLSLNGKEIIGDYKLVDKDPVVLCKVDGGYLQVSCWGDESSIDEFKVVSKN